MRYDVKRRKVLAVNTVIQVHLFKNRKITTNDEMNLFQSCITSIFLHNCEPWEITKKNYESYLCDSFHETLIGTFFLNVKWSKVITNI